MTQRALVTGANRGLGREVAGALAQRGYRVLIAARDAAAGAATAAELRAQGGDVEARTLDVADPTSVRALAAGTEPIDVLVNNAGASLQGFDGQVAARTLATNYFGAAAVTDALAPRLARDARVVMVSSGMGTLDHVAEPLRARFLDPALDRAGLDALMHAFVAAVRAGRHGREGWPSNAYAVSKVGLNALVRVLAPALHPRGILVNAVCPGWVRTDMGGASAPRSLAQGAAGIVWAATLPPGGPTGGFFRDGRAIAW